MAVVLAAAPQPARAEAQADDDDTSILLEEPQFEDPTDVYALDNVSRTVPERGRVKCPDITLVRYRGDFVRYHKAVRVNVHFRARLREFEKIVRETSIEVYGRAPRRIRHLGSYSCRRIGGWPTYISEHGLGNALDIEGFEFARANRDQAARIPKRLRGGFTVTVERHWHAKRGIGKVHARFLRLLATRVVQRWDLFRVMLGPADSGHDDHFHFDCAPWRFVEI